MHRQATWKPGPQQLIATVGLPVPSVRPSQLVLQYSIGRSRAKKFYSGLPGPDVIHVVHHKRMTAAIVRVLATLLTYNFLREL